VRKVISGVVGAASSVTSIQVANLLRLFKIPQVSDTAELREINTGGIATPKVWQQKKAIATKS
jgi:hypothetical protein